LGADPILTVALAFTSRGSPRVIFRKLSKLFLTGRCGRVVGNNLRCSAPRCPIWSKLNSPELGLGEQHNYTGAHEKVGNVWGDGSFLNSVDGITPNPLMPSDSRKNMAVFF
jgi:hypothetical protein